MEAWVWVVVVLGAGAAIGATALIRRRVYLGKIRELGWAHDSRPRMEVVSDLQAPPFALGLDRSVDELITGTTTGGFPFRVFEYDYTGAGPKYSARIAVLRLPYAFPDVFVFGPGATDRAGVGLGGRQFIQVERQGLRVISADASLAGEVATVIGPAAQAFGQFAAAIDLSLDGPNLVAVGAPKDTERLAAFLGALDWIAQALISPGISARQVSPVVPSPFYGHPDWLWIDVDHSVLDIYPVSRGGYGHRTEKLVRGLRDGIRMDAFLHHWMTDRTVTETDAEGRTHTRTETDHHREAMCGFVLPFSMPAISLNGRRVGEKVRFESAEFNRAFTVRTEDPKFASDVTHPRMMEWLLAVQPNGWSVLGQIVVFDVAEHDVFVIDGCEATLRGWLGRVPRFVWQNLRMAEPPFLIE